MNKKWLLIALGIIVVLLLIILLMNLGILPNPQIELVP